MSLEEEDAIAREARAPILALGARRVVLRKMGRTVAREVALRANIFAACVVCHQGGRQGEG